MKQLGVDQPNKWIMKRSWLGDVIGDSASVGKIRRAQLEQIS